MLQKFREYSLWFVSLATIPPRPWQMRLRAAEFPYQSHRFNIVGKRKQFLTQMQINTLTIMQNIYIG